MNGMNPTMPDPIPPTFHQINEDDLEAAINSLELFLRYLDQLINETNSQIDNMKYGPTLKQEAWLFKMVADRDKVRDLIDKLPRPISF